MDPALIERYAAGAWMPAESIVGLKRADLIARPVPDTWSIQEIVLHLMDSDLIASDRMKRVIAEDRPTIIGYDETRFARELFYQDLDVQFACDIFAKNRILTADILRRLPESAFARTGLHNEAGKKSLADFVKGYIEHLEHHLRFVRDKRRLLGKPLA